MKVQRFSSASLVPAPISFFLANDGWIPKTFAAMDLSVGITPRQLRHG